MTRARTRQNRRGFVLVTMAASALVIFGALGLSVDIGRMYVAKSEVQAFTDAAALAATLRLNGTNSASMPHELQRQTASTGGTSTARMCPVHRLISLPQWLGPGRQTRRRRRGIYAPVFERPCRFRCISWGW